MTIKAVYFDLGGVIVRTEFQAPREHMAERLGLTYEELVKIVFESRSSQDASIGRITEDEHWKNVARALHRPLKDRDALRTEFFAGDIVDRELIAFIRSLRPKYRTGLISNAWDGLPPYLEREKFADVFDDLTISAKVGVMKPDPAIFQHALAKLGVKPREAVFVDDFAENITGCEAIGMHGMLFKSTEQVLKGLKKVLK
jgi:epoxide hydrolase-like predicted phosphatase